MAELRIQKLEDPGAGSRGNGPQARSPAESAQSASPLEPSRPTPGSHKHLLERST